MYVYICYEWSWKGTLIREIPWTCVITGAERETSKAKQAVFDPMKKNQLPDHRNPADVVMGERRRKGDERETYQKKKQVHVLFFFLFGVSVLCVHVVHILPMVCEI